MLSNLYIGIRLRVNYIFKVKGKIVHKTKEMRAKYGCIWLPDCANDQSRFVFFS